jgi:hypothetical protein
MWGRESRPGPSLFENFDKYGSRERKRPPIGCFLRLAVQFGFASAAPAWRHYLATRKTGFGVSQPQFLILRLVHSSAPSTPVEPRPHGDKPCRSPIERPSSAHSQRSTPRERHARDLARDPPTTRLGALVSRRAGRATASGTPCRVLVAPRAAGAVARSALGERHAPLRTRLDLVRRWQGAGSRPSELTAHLAALASSTAVRARSPRAPH